MDFDYFSALLLIVALCYFADLVVDWTDSDYYWMYSLALI